MILKMLRKRPMVWLAVPYILLTALFARAGTLGNEYLPGGSDVEVTGQVSYISGRSEKYKLLLEECTISHENGSIYAEQLLVYMPSASVKIGNLINLSGEYYEFENARNPGQFDSKKYYAAREIYAYVYSDTAAVLDSSVKPVENLLNRLTLHMIELYNKYFSEEQAGMLTAMLHGEKAYLGEDQKSNLQKNGISHIMAVSGLHISFAGMGVFAVLRKVKVRRGYACAAAAGTAFLYSCMTGFSISSQRAVIMLSILLLGKAIGKSYDMLSSLALAAVVVLTINPKWIFDAGFLLSFSAICGIAIFKPLLEKALPKCSHALARGLLQSVTTALGVQLATLPVLLYFYYELPIYSLFLNILVVPLMPLITVGVLLLAVIDIIFKSGAFFIAGLPHYIMTFIEQVCNLANLLPYHTVLTGQPGMVQIVIYYLSFAAAGVAIHIKKQKQVIKLAALGAAFLLTGTIFFVFKEKEAELAFLDVGQGDCIYIDSGTNIHYMFDGGSSDEKSVGQYTISPFLKWSGSGIIDYWFVTHSDSDHLSGLIELMTKLLEEGQKRGVEAFTEADYKGNILINNIIIPFHAEGFEQLISLSDKLGIPVHYMKAGDVLLHESIDIICEAPAEGITYTSANAGSLAVSVNFPGDFNLLLTGDIEGEGEQFLTQRLKENKQGEYDLLKVAHHGSKFSSAEEFLCVVNPKIAVISCGRDNRYGHPHEEILERLGGRGADIYITAQDGAEIFHFE